MFLSGKRRSGVFNQSKYEYFSRYRLFVFGTSCQDFNLFSNFQWVVIRLVEAGNRQTSLRHRLNLLWRTKPSKSPWKTFYSPYCVPCLRSILVSLVLLSSKFRSRCYTVKMKKISIRILTDFIFLLKIKNFDKNSNRLHISAQNIDYGR